MLRNSGVQATVGGMRAATCLSELTSELTSEVALSYSGSFFFNCNDLPPLFKVIVSCRY